MTDNQNVLHGPCWLCLIWQDAMIESIIMQLPLYVSSWVSPMHAKIHSMFKTIQRMVHRVWTAFGDSEMCHGGDYFENWLFVPQGILQGNASGPAIWTIISSLIFDIIRTKGYSNRFCSAISKELFLLVGFAYVDNCDLIQSGQVPINGARSM